MNFTTKSASCTITVFNHVRVAALAALSLLTVGTNAMAQGFGTELLVNGDAETGTLAGWDTAADGMVALSWAEVGSGGLADSAVLGQFAFTGREGPPTQTMTQTIDLAAHADAIDTNALQCRFSVLLMSIRAGGYTDSASAKVEWLSSSGSPLLTLSYTDYRAPELVLDWEPITIIRPAPVGTRQVRVTLSTTRIVGSSSDGWIDNASFRIAYAPPCPPDFNGDGFVTGTDFDEYVEAILQGYWSADFDGDGFITGADFDLFVQAFEQGC